MYERAAADPEAWWSEQAEALDWFEPWDRVLDDSNPPFYKWFVGGQLNVSYNCLDRHVEAGRGDASRSTGAASRASSATSPTPSCCATFRGSPTR